MVVTGFECYSEERVNQMGGSKQQRQGKEEKKWKIEKDIIKTISLTWLSMIAVQCHPSTFSGIGKANRTEPTESKRVIIMMDL